MSEKKTMIQYLFHTITLGLGSWVYHRGTKRRGDGPHGAMTLNPSKVAQCGQDETSKIGYFSLGEETEEWKARNRA